MTTPAEMPRKFKGIWIPKEIWLNHKLTPLQKCLAAEIDSIGENDGYCFASDAYLAKMFHVGIGRMKNMLTELRNLGIIESCGFDAQKRRLLRLKLPVTESVTPVTKPVTPPVTDSVTPHIERDKSLEISKVRNDLHEAIAVWVQAYNLHHVGKKYANEVAKRSQPDERAMRGLLKSGRSPEAIGELAERMFTAADTGDEKNHWQCCNCLTIERFCASIGNIEKELKVKTNGVMRGLTPEELAEDEAQKTFYGSSL